MISTLISLFPLLLKLATIIISTLHDKQLIAAGKAEAVAEAMRKQIDDLANSVKAREDARSRAEHDPASILRDDDGFRRD